MGQRTKHSKENTRKWHSLNVQAVSRLSRTGLELRRGDAEASRGNHGKWVVLKKENRPTVLEFQKRARSRRDPSAALSTSADSPKTLASTDLTFLRIESRRKIRNCGFRFTRRLLSGDKFLNDWEWSTQTEGA